MDDLASEILVQDIDHLGIVAGIIDKIGLVEEVDRRLGNHSQESQPNLRKVGSRLLTVIEESI